MIHRHLPCKRALHHRTGGHRHSVAADPAKLGCSSRNHACRRLLLLTQALDGRGEQTIVNSVAGKASTGAITTDQQQQQQLATTQSEACSTSSAKQGAAATLPNAAEAAAADASTSNQQSQTVSPWVPSWESWCAHFEQQDAYGTRLDTLAMPLAAAVAAEDYAAAAALKSEMNELVALDAVATVQQQLAGALAAERYAEAAELRDKGWALLEGWWACMSPQNPRGHLLRIFPEYGRWTGKAYSPRDLGELQGWTDDEPGRMVNRSSSGSARRQGTGFSRRKAGRRGSAAALDAQGLAQLGTPIMEVFVRREGQQGAASGEAEHVQQQQQQWSSQAVLLQPAGSAAAGVAAGAARDIGLEAEIGELFRSAVSAAVWGKSGLEDDTAAAAAANLANSSSSSSSDANSMYSSLVRNVSDDGSGLSPFASSTSARFEGMVGENGQVLGAGGLAAAVAAEQLDELEPWEELLNSAESLIRTAAAAADMNGGVLCADGELRPVQRQQQQQHVTPVLQLLIEVVEGSKNVLLAARAVTPEVTGVTSSTGVTGGTACSTAITHGATWVFADMPAGPEMVTDWSKVETDQVPERQARIAALLEAQRIVRDMLGAQEYWWMTEFMGSWTPPAAAAAAEQQQQQQQQQTSDAMDWQLPLQLLQQQQDLQEQQQPQPFVQGSLPDQRGDMTLLETAEDDDDDSWPALDAVSRAGFYPGFYQDYGPGVDAPAVQPAATAAYAGFEQQAAAAATDTAAAAEGRFSGMSPAEVEEALETLAELKDAAQNSSSSSATNSSSSSRWLPPDGVSTALHQQQHSKGSRRHTGAPAVTASSSSSSSNWPPVSPAAAIGVAVAASGFGAEFMNTGDELERHPAAITMHSRDKFTIKPSRQGVASDAAAAAAERDGSSNSGSTSIATEDKSGSSSSSGTRPRRSLYVVEVPTSVMHSKQQQQQGAMRMPKQQQQGHSSGFFSSEGHDHGPAADAADCSIGIQSRGYRRVWQLAAHQLLLQHACSSSSSEPLPITWRQPLADLMAARAASVLWGAAGFSAVEADEACQSENADLSSSSSSSSNLAVDENAPVLVLQLPPELVDRTLAAVADSKIEAAAKAAAAAAATVHVPKSPVVAAAAAAAAAGTAGIAAAIDPQAGLTYRRLQTKQQRSTDPFQGLFLGSFGPHGPELLALSRTMCMDSGEELLLGLKLTGDPNVPAGQVSFRARVGSRHKRAARNIYPPQLDVTARYPGEGRVAGPNFSNPRWVEGELLVFNSSSSSSSSWTSGAQLGFVYSMPGEKRFLILLNRVALE